MRGLTSRRPATWSIRLLMGSEMLLFVTVVLLLGSANTLDGTLIAIVIALVSITVAAFLFALIGEPFVRGRRDGR